MRYTVILEQEPDGGFVASVPALPGCVSWGDNRAQALRNIREAGDPVSVLPKLCWNA
jgi:predicted RNase H-like HicB family nuclease